MDGDTLLQLVALLLGGGAVSGGTAYWHRRVGPSTQSTNGTAEAIRNLRTTVEGIRDDMKAFRAKLDSDQERHANERAELRQRVALIEREIERSA